MNRDQIQPLPDDTGRTLVESMLDARDEPWWLLDEGDYSCAAVEAWQSDGSHRQVLIALELPVRLNRGSEKQMIRVLVSEDDAAGIARTVAHTARWLQARKSLKDSLDGEPSSGS